MILLDYNALEEIALGAAVLGTGGGGDPTLGKLMAQQAVAKHGPVQLLPLDDVPDDEWIIPTAMMGAPTVLVEKIPSGTEVLDAYRMLERRLQCRAAATVSAEAGGVNSMIPMVVATTLGVPLVDADGMGRAFPEIQMVTPTLHGVSATPMAIADEKGNQVLLETPDNFWTERLARTATIQMGCSSCVALYAMRGRVAKKALVPGTISLARAIGHTLRTVCDNERWLASCEPSVPSAGLRRGPQPAPRSPWSGWCTARHHVRRSAGSQLAPQPRLRRTQYLERGRGAG